MNRRTIGIDLGTSHSSVAAIGVMGQPVLIPSQTGALSIPSVVSVLDACGGEPEILVGAQALRAAATHPQDTLVGFKRLMGRRFAERDVQRFARTLPFLVTPAPNGDAWTQAGGLALSPAELSARVLRELRALAEAHLGEPVREAVITVPAHFDSEQRRATRDAAEIAGLEVRRLLNEPTAAVLGCRAHRGKYRRLAVCDLGAGTFDVSIVNVERGVIEVISNAGDLFLGGKDLDGIILDHLVDEIRQQRRLDVGDDPPSLQRLLDECRRAKHLLSQQDKAEISAVLAIGAAPLEYRRVLEREELEFWIESLLDNLELPCLEAAARCGLRPRDVDAVLVVGGATRTLAVQHKLAGIFSRQPLVANQGEVVAVGAARLCGILDGVDDPMALLDVTSRAFGIHVGGGVYQQVIARNSAVPTREHKILSTTRDGQREVELDVYEGESPALADNRLLGRFVCTGLPEAPAGQVLVMFDFTVDVDGILAVSASELGTNRRPELHLRATAGLTRAHVHRLRDSLAV
jgi:molecular chaperone DnaK